MDSKRVYIVPHSHWDREWYFTIEDSNLILAENMSHLLNVLKNDESYTGYVFDGQLSVVEEYLKVEPGKKELIKELVTAKRLFIGPWYTQADSLLVHKESLVRNLLYGVLGAEAFGHSMNVGYLPDIFGQNTYLPSVFNGFGIDYSILQRGIYTDELNGDVHFNWESPDGLGVKSALLPLGYGPGKFLEAEEAYREETLYPLVDKISRLSSRTNHILFPSGGDQVLVREQFPETVSQLNKLEDGNTYVLSDYETYMEETWDDKAFTHTIKGELIGTELSRMHRTIRSQRYDIKYWNSLVEHKLIDQLEPLAVIGLQEGLTYPKARIDEMWKELFDVHAHDSIGGCNSDETNRAIVERLKKVNRQVDGLMNIIKKQLTQAVVKGNSLENCLVVFNTQAKQSVQSFETILFTREEHIVLEDADGRNVSFSLIESEYVDGGKKIQVTDEGEKQIPLPGYYKHKILVQSATIPSLGYTTFNIKPSESKSSRENDEGLKGVENNLYKLVVDNNKLIATDKTSGTDIKNFIRFEDTADAGDSYDYSPLVGSEAIYLTETELVSAEVFEHVQKMTVTHKGKLPARLNDRKDSDSPEMVDFEVTTILELRS
ncbi:glycoside hydrolase family 38 N-terminal domain-containing protein, partial [Alkalibacterium sp.]